MASSTGSIASLLRPLTSFRAVATWVIALLLSSVLLTNTLVSASNVHVWGGPCESSTSSVPSCMDCCQERKCKSRCVDRCKNKAEKTAEDKEDFCKSYKGQDHYDYSHHLDWYEEELHEHPRGDCNSDHLCGLCEGDCDKDSHCKGNLKCKEEWHRARAGVLGLWQGRVGLLLRSRLEQWRKFWQQSGTVQ